MTTYSSTGIAVLRSSILGEEDVIKGVKTGVDLSIYAPVGTTTLRYTNSANPEDANQPIADIQVTGGIGYIEGDSLDEDEASILRVRWSDNGTIRTTTVLVLTFFEADVDGYSDVDADAIFVLDGDPLPTITTAAQWKAFDGSIVSIGPATGTYAPNTDIPLSAFFSASSENDLIIGTMGDDSLYGGAGDDTINPVDNTYDDYIVPGTGNDRVVLSDVQTGWVGIGHSDLNAGITATINGKTNSGQIDKGANGTTQIIDVVNPMEADGFAIYGTAYDDVFNVTVQEGGWIQLRGRGGDDQFVIDNGKGGVRLDYRYAQSGVTADLGAGTVSDDGDGGSDQISGTGHPTEIRTSMFNDSVTGSSRGESFILAAGEDTVNGGGGADLLRYDRTGVEAIDLNLNTGTATGTWRGATFTHTISGIEHVRGSRDGNDVITGNGVANRLEGRGGNDILKGLGGNDRLLGEDGSDKLYGGFGRDTLEGGTHNDRLVGQAGNDRLVGGSGHDRLIGGSQNDTLVGQFGNDKLYGGNGWDVLYGGGHNDLMLGQLGNDRMFGGNGNDRLLGGAHNDRLFGGAGRDTLDGGTGNDFLQGHGGADTFVFSAGADQVKDFAADDVIDLSNASGIDSFADLSNNHLSEASGNVIITDDSGHSMTLLDRSISDLSAGDFLF